MKRKVNKHNQTNIDKEELRLFGDHIIICLICGEHYWVSQGCSKNILKGHKK